MVKLYIQICLSTVYIAHWHLPYIFAEDSNEKRDEVTIEEQVDITKLSTYNKICSLFLKKRRQSGRIVISWHMQYSWHKSG